MSVDCLKFKTSKRPQFCSHLSSPVGIEYNNKKSAHYLDLYLMSSTKLAKESLFKFEPKTFSLSEHPDLSLAPKLFECFNDIKSLNYIKVLLDGKKHIFFDGNTQLHSYAFKVNCAHRHYNPELSEEKNKQLYYKCFYPHGHEYELIITVCSDISFRFTDLVKWGEDQIVDPYNKSFLNDKMGNTSGELILEFFANKLLNNLRPNFKLVNLTLKETFKNSFVKVFDNDLHALF